MLTALSGNIPNFYLTGGTALSRFYLHHRYSEDLDFFANQMEDFSGEVLRVRKLLSETLQVSEEKIIQYETFSRIWISNGSEVKIELINDIKERWGEPVEHMGIHIDNPANILANKLTAILSRDEPKDIFDIVSIAESYSFNWEVAFSYAIKKAYINEPDIAIRLRKFPVQLVTGNLWLPGPVDTDAFGKKLDTIAHDFIMARDNTLGTNQMPIEKARLRIAGESE